MIMNSNTCDSAIDFENIASAISNHDLTSLIEYLDRFNTDIKAHLDFNLEDPGPHNWDDLGENVIWGLLRGVDFEDKDHILPSLYSAYTALESEQGFRGWYFRRIGIQFDRHLWRLEPVDIERYFEGRVLPIVFSCTHLIQNVQNAIHSNKPIDVTEGVGSLILGAENSCGLRAMLFCFTLNEQPEVLVDSLKLLVTEDGKSLFTLMNPLISPVTENCDLSGMLKYHMEDFHNVLLYLAQREDPPLHSLYRIFQDMFALREMLKWTAKQSYAYLVEFGWERLLLHVLFYQQLAKYNVPIAKAIRKYMVAANFIGFPSRSFQNITEFCNHFSRAEQKFFSRFDPILCSMELQCHRKEYDNTQIRFKFLDLLCINQSQMNGLEEYNLIDHPYDEEGELLEGEKDMVSPMYFIQEEIYGTENKQQIHALFRVAARWLEAHQKVELHEEWHDAPPAPTYYPQSVLEYYDEVIQDIVNHEKYCDDQIAKRLTDAYYGYFFDQISFKNRFFKAYYSESESEAIRFYEDILNEDHEYDFATSVNLAGKYIDVGEYELAQNLISQLGDGEWKEKRQKQLDQKIERANTIKNHLPEQKDSFELSELGDSDLLLLAAVTLAAYDSNSQDYVQTHDQLRTYLVPHFHSSHLIIETLMKNGVLVPVKNSWSNINPEDVSKYSFTSLPMTPNVKGYLAIAVFVGVIKDEVLNREICSKVISECESKLKVAWLMNKFEYMLDKIGMHQGLVPINTEDQIEIEALVSKFSPSQLHSIGWNAVNFVSGTMHTHGFGISKAAERMVPRLKKSLKESSGSNFGSKTFGRPDISAFPLESVLTWADGLNYQERFLKR